MAAFILMGAERETESPSSIEPRVSEKQSEREREHDKRVCARVCVHPAG